MSEQVSVRYWFSYSKEKVFVCKKALQFAHLTKKEWFINLYIFPLNTQFLFFKKILCIKEICIPEQLLIKHYYHMCCDVFHCKVWLYSPVLNGSKESRLKISKFITTSHLTQITAQHFAVIWINRSRQNPLFQFPQQKELLPASLLKIV